MGGPLLTRSATALCPHGGLVQLDLGDRRALALGNAFVLVGESFIIRGCVTPVPGTCVSASWSIAASRTKAGGVPIALAAAGCCIDSLGRDTGSIKVLSLQDRVIGF
jgi:hypothetical protein